MKWLYLYISWIVALIATFGSIYLSEVENVTPCPLCWYQRVCMFPLIFILGIAVYKHFYRITIYILPQVIIGRLIALYQSVETYFPHILPFEGDAGGWLLYKEIETPVTSARLNPLRFRTPIPFQHNFADY